MEGRCPQEISLYDALTLINSGTETGLISCETEDVLGRLKLSFLNDQIPFDDSGLDELMFDGLSNEECVRKMDEMAADDSLSDEVKRIFAPENKRIYKGIPVQYELIIKDKTCMEDTIRILMGSLIQNYRLLGSRAEVMSPTTISYMLNNGSLEQLLQAAYGQTVIFDLRSASRMFGSLSDDDMESLAGLVNKYGEGVQCFFLLNEEKSMSYSYTNFFDKVSKIFTIVKIEEGKAYGMKRDSNKCQEMCGVIEKAYPAYENLVKAKMAEPGIVQNDSYAILSNMHGLDRPKKIIREILTHARIRERRAKMGLKNSCSSMHMVFTGNPGTAKTTVARLFAGILKDEGILRTGAFVEAGRKDLIGEYVGQTAPKVTSCFERAAGGVLFIDEAYSMVDGYRGYCDEAISTIVQEMENRRDDVVVIFAGYPEPMHSFLDQNEGLKSRISYYVPFDDYTPDELYEIMRIQANEKDYMFAKGVREAVMPIFQKAATQKDFGNGRFTRNLIEHAIMKQSERLEAEEAELAQCDYDLNVLGKEGEEPDDLTPDDYRELQACDFEKVALSDLISYNDNKEAAVIGF